MVVLTSSEKEYVYAWVGLFKASYKLSNRELVITQELVYRYYLLVKASGKMSKNSKKDYDPFKRFKEKDVLESVCADLGISFLVLRTYLTVLKSKGVFVGSGFSEKLVPKEGGDIIEVCLK